MSEDTPEKNAQKYLTLENTRMARFYHQPKIHKLTVLVDPLCLHAEPPISEYVDLHLQPLVALTPSYLIDTTDFLQKLSEITTLPTGCILGTLDVSSLYTNIPHEEGMAACNRALDTRLSPSPPMSYLLRMMELILKLNNFVQRRALPTDPRNGNGNQDGTVICKPVHGGTGNKPTRLD